MLSRVAERIYWMARYLERAENTARLVNAYYLTVLDLPRGQEPGWDLLLDITVSRGTFLDHYSNLSERNIVKFLLSDSCNPGSVEFCIKAARENSRTAREVLTPALWEELNELQLFIKENSADATSRRHRYEFLQKVIQKSQQITGLIENVICRTQGYRFLQLGRHIERADMTTRILDAGVNLVQRQEADEESTLRYDNVMWRHTLSSLDALTMYRLRIGPRINAKGVRTFLLKDVSFPRSVNYCLQEIGVAIRHLPNRRKALAHFSEIQDELINTESAMFSSSDLIAHLDSVQCGLNGLSNTIMQTWCYRDHSH